MDRSSEQTDQLHDEVQQLVWALVDDVATDEQVQRLERMLLENGEARETYINCMQLHSDLHFLFREEQSAAGTPIAPILDSLPPTGTTISPPELNL